ncbi:hypothetical protein WEH80_06605 [Actinomycetes bacterium KLBMP 9759]
MSDAIGALLDYLENLDKGQLHTCSLIREDDADWIEVAFSLDARPGIEYTFRRGITDAAVEPEMGTHLDVSIFLSSIMRRIHTRTHAVDGKISLD